MENINFYNWRQEQQILRNKFNQAYLFICVILGCLIAFSIFQLKSNSLSALEKEKSFIESQITLMEGTKKEIDSINNEKKLIIDQINVIQNLQKERPILVYSLDELVMSIPNNVYLTNFSRVDNIASFQGVALSNEDVGIFIKKLNETETFENPKIIDIKTLQKEGFLDSVQFNIIANINVTNENIIKE